MVLIEGQADAIASYNYEDIDSGTGITSYYCYSAKDADGEIYKISKNLVYSYTKLLEHVSTGVGYTETTTFYSGILNTPKVIFGNILLKLCVDSRDLGGNHVDFEVKIYHYDGSTSTQIGDTWQSEELQTETHNMNCSIPITTPAKFRVGDQIKMEIKSYLPQSTEHLKYGIDPMNRDSSPLMPSEDPDETTVMKLDIPFKLNT
jgi:hypothetical protein